MKHTKGPWGYSNDLNRNSGTPGYSVGVAGHQIAEIDQTDNAMGRDAEANARLISAAPEMLEVLVEYVAEYDREHKHEDHRSCISPEPLSYIMAKQIISKAEGL